MVLDATPPLHIGQPQAIVVNATRINISWDGVFDDPESGMDWFEWELENPDAPNQFRMSNTTEETWILIEVCPYSGEGALVQGAAAVPRRFRACGPPNTTASLRR